MVAPIVAVPAAAALAGGGAAALGSLAGSGSQKQMRKDVQVQRTYSPTVNRSSQKTVNKTRNVSKTISPSSSRQLNYNPQVIVDSPSAGIGSKLSQKSKKGGSSSSAKAPTRQTPTLPVVQKPRSGGDQRTGDQGQTSAGGKGDLTTLALIGGAAYVLAQGDIL